VWVVISITFVVVRVIPGNPAYLYAGSFPTKQIVKQFEEKLGTDRPIPVQYVHYVGNLARLNFGTSVQTNRPVLHDLTSRVPATVELTLSALVLAIIAGIASGVLMAARPQNPISRVLAILTAATAAIPEFWLGIVLIAIFYVHFGIAPAPVGRVAASVNPPSGPTGLHVVDGILHWQWDVVGSSLAHLVLPACTLAIIAVPPIARVTQATMRSVFGTDFVLAARANGDFGIRLYFRRILPVAMPPIVTSIGIVSGYLIAGDFLIEKVFAWPGVGLYAVNGLAVNDFNVIVGAVFFSTLVYVIIFVAVDLLNALLDPRSGLMHR
jgi:peptide/nickel transport system permease protein